MQVKDPNGLEKSNGKFYVGTRVLLISRTSANRQKRIKLLTMAGVCILVAVFPLVHMHRIW